MYTWITINIFKKYEIGSVMTFKSCNVVDFYVVLLLDFCSWVFKMFRNNDIYHKTGSCAFNKYSRFGTSQNSIPLEVWDGRILWYGFAVSHHLQDKAGQL